MKNISIKISDLRSAQQDAQQCDYVVSILNPGAIVPKFNCLHHVEVFRDGYHIVDNYYLTPQNIHRLLNFGAQNFKSNDNILVHCHYGVSRSPAMGILYYIQVGFSPEDAFNRISDIRSKMMPNPTIIRYGDEIFGLKNELNNQYLNFVAKTREQQKKKRIL